MRNLNRRLEALEKRTGTGRVIYTISDFLSPMLNPNRCNSSENLSPALQLLLDETPNQEFQENTADEKSAYQA